MGPRWRTGPWAFSILSFDTFLDLLVGTTSCLPSLDLVTICFLHGQSKAGRVSQCPTKTHCSPLGRNTHGPWSSDHYYQDNSEMLTVSPGCSCTNRVQPRQCKVPPSQRDHADSLLEAFLLVPPTTFPRPVECFLTQ